MLQQTRVETVVPYFERWMARFPTVAALAAAPLQEVLSLWEGLGYYSRARNLHAAAQKVVTVFEGKLPEEARALRSLPGIGPYAAGAIASIGFGQDEAALDGNARRVYARVFDVEVPARSSEGDRRLWQIARAQIPPGRAGDFNQALMDLGATICTPRSPKCPICPLADRCEANRLGLQEVRPVAIARAAIPHRTAAAGAIVRSDFSEGKLYQRALLLQREEKGLLGGMWSFPSIELDRAATKNEKARIATLQPWFQKRLQRELGLLCDIDALLGTYHHTYTHFRATLHTFCCTWTEGEPDVATPWRWVPLAELASYPMGKLDRGIARDLVATGAGDRDRQS